MHPDILTLIINGALTHVREGCYMGSPRFTSSTVTVTTIRRLSRKKLCDWLMDRFEMTEEHLAYRMIHVGFDTGLAEVDIGRHGPCEGDSDLDDDNEPDFTFTRTRV